VSWLRDAAGGLSGIVINKFHISFIADAAQPEAQFFIYLAFFDGITCLVFLVALALIVLAAIQHLDNVPAKGSFERF